MSASPLRDRIVGAAADLLASGGVEAMTTRSVSAAAGVQPPAIYRFFADKHALLEAATSHAFGTYVADKEAMPPTGDPVDDLRRGWDLHVGFGLASPHVYAAIYGGQHGQDASAAQRQADEVLTGLVQRIAAAGRLLVPVAQAAHLVHASGRGVVLSLIGTPEASRDPELSVLAREGVLAAITVPELAASGEGEPAGSAAISQVAAAVTLRAGLSVASPFTRGEHALLEELLDRLGASGPGAAGGLPPAAAGDHSHPAREPIASPHG